jgi:hypothetical protein
MAKIISKQNANIETGWEHYDGFIVYSNHRLALNLGIKSPPAEYIQNYTEHDISVKVI